MFIMVIWSIVFIDCSSYSVYIYIYLSSTIGISLINHCIMSIEISYESIEM